MIKRLKGIRNTNPSLCASGIVTANYEVNYDVLNLKEENINLEFIASSLSKICRYIGHVGQSPKEFYSVAQHATMMAESALLAFGDPILAFECLHHDDGEAYCGDMISPLKSLIKDTIKPIENNIDKVICQHLGINYPHDPRVKQIDLNICEYELSFMVLGTGHSDFWSPELAYKRFMEMHQKIKTLLEYDQKELHVNGMNQEAKSKEESPTSILEEFTNKNKKEEHRNCIRISDVLSITMLEYLGFSHVQSNIMGSCHYMLIDFKEKTLIPIVNAFNYHEMSNFLELFCYMKLKKDDIKIFLEGLYFSIFPFETEGDLNKTKLINGLLENFTEIKDDNDSKKNCCFFDYKIKSFIKSNVDNLHKNLLHELLPDLHPELGHIPE